MAFWGVEIRPGKPYIHNFDQSRGRLRISQATLGDGKSESKSTGQCIVGNSSPVSLCSLIPNVSETCHLELEFEEEKEVTFSVLGPRSIHLTGYYPGHVRRLDGDDSESYGEDIAESDTSDSCTDVSEDEYESDFIDDDDDLVYANFPVKKSSVVIEEIEDDDKSCEKNRKLRRLKKHVSSDVDDAETGSKQLDLTNKGSAKVESEDEDGFPIFFTPKSSSKKKITDDKKSKTDGTSQVTVSTSEAKENLNSGTPADTITENNVKPKKKKKNNGTRSIGIENDKKQNKPNETMEVEEKSEADANISVEESRGLAKESINGAKDTNNGISGSVTSADPDACKVIKKKNKKKRTREEGMSDEKDLCKDKINSYTQAQDDCMAIDMKMKTKKNKKKSSDSDKNDVTSVKEKADLMAGVDSQHGSQSNRTRTFPNGLIVEEVSMGKPEGKKATPGKKVSVHYIGKLKNGTIFDSNIGQRPFKFRLGIGEVIKGWDIGVNGMRVGDKRKLTIPPSFGYGAKNMGKISPNSWLLFDVELVDVQ